LLVLIPYRKNRKQKRKKKKERSGLLFDRSKKGSRHGSEEGGRNVRNLLKKKKTRVGEKGEEGKHKKDATKKDLFASERRKMHSH